MKTNLLLPFIPFSPCLASQFIIHFQSFTGNSYRINNLQRVHTQAHCTVQLITHSRTESLLGGQSDWRYSLSSETSCLCARSCVELRFIFSVDSRVFFIFFALKTLWSEWMTCKIQQKERFALDVNWNFPAFIFQQQTACTLDCGNGALGAVRLYGGLKKCNTLYFVVGGRTGATQFR